MSFGRNVASVQQVPTISFFNGVAQSADTVLLRTIGSAQQQHSVDHVDDIIGLKPPGNRDGRDIALGIGGSSCDTRLHAAGRLTVSVSSRAPRSQKATV
jgi:hypothetical protein